MKPKHFKQKHVNSLGQSGFTILIIIFALLIITGIVLSLGISIGPVNPSQIMQMIPVGVSMWFLLLGGGVFVVIFCLVMVQVMPNRPELYTIVKIGMAMICLSLLVVIVSYLLPLLSAKVLTFGECKQLIESNILRTIACMFVGYVPTGQVTTVTYVNFIITAIICPFFFFYYMFVDLIRDMNFPSDRNAQRVIAFIGAFLALRGLLAGYFVQFFAYSWLGMGVLVFGVFMMMMAWALIRRFFAGVIQQHNMQQLFAMLSGRMPMNARALLTLVANNPDPYGFLSNNSALTLNILNAAGLPGVATQVQTILINANALPVADRNNYVRTELQNLIATIH